MPAFIKTPADEARWAKAKEAANKQHSESEGDKYWGLVNHIYQNIGKAELAKSIRDLIKENPDTLKPELLDKVLNTLLKARDDEEDDGESDDHQNYGMDENELPEHMRVTDDPFEDEGDEGSKWLQEHDGEDDVSGPAKVPSAEGATEDSDEVVDDKTGKSGGYSEWKPKAQYKPEHQKKMKELMDQGYSHREAERMAGAYDGPKDFQSALKHTVKPSQPSPKMMEQMKGLAGHWLDRADRHAKVNADPEKNPQKFAAGKMMQAHEEHAKDFNKDYDTFLNSDKVKGMKGLERHKAIQSWKNDWKQKNPQYTEGASGVSDAGKHYKESRDAKQKNLNDAIQHITTGGQSGEGMSFQEAAQHVGGAKSDEGYTATTIKDPSASFAEANPDFVKRLNADQLDRFNRVQGARASQGFKPSTVVRKKPMTGGEGT